ALPDTDRLAAILRAGISKERGSPAADEVREFARRFPGQYFEADVAQILIGLGREAEASTVLERLLPRVLTGSGPRWLWAMASLSVVAATPRDTAAAARLYEAFEPYRGWLIVLG